MRFSKVLCIMQIELCQDKSNPDTGSTLVVCLSARLFICKILNDYQKLIPLAIELIPLAIELISLVI